AFGLADERVVVEGTLVSVELLARLEREGVVAPLRVGQLDQVAGLEGPAAVLGSVRCAGGFTHGRESTCGSRMSMRGYLGAEYPLAGSRRAGFERAVSRTGMSRVGISHAGRRARRRRRQVRRRSRRRVR